MALLARGSDPPAPGGLSVRDSVASRWALQAREDDSRHTAGEEVAR